MNEKPTIAQEAATILAEKLDETSKAALKQIEDVLNICGEDFAHETLEETLKTVADGGMLTLKGDRKRTTGGVFFALAKDKMTAEQRALIFPQKSWRQMRESQRNKIRENIMDYANRGQVIKRIKSKGEIVDVRVKLIGYPGDIRRQGETIVMQMEHLGGGASLPLGVPDIPDTPTLYTVYIANQQWKRVQKSFGKDEDDNWLVVEGVCTFDPDLNGIAVFATGLKVQRAKNKQKTNKSVTKPSKTDITPTPPLVVEPLKMEIPDGMPPSAEKKLRELYTAAEQFRRKIEDLQTRPEDKQTGLSMTQKLLASTERQIENLVKKHN